MAVIKIESFGGELPSVSTRALPANAAQVSKNLMLSSNEFRPLGGPAPAEIGVTLKDIGGAAGTDIRSLYRPGTGYAWHASAFERSFVRTPINDLGLAGRTYFSTDEPSSYPAAFDGVAFDSERRLGVPAPMQPVTRLVTNESVTLDRAWNYLYRQAGKAILDALKANTFKSAEPLDRFADLDGSGPQGITVFAGTRSTGSLIIPWASGNPALPTDMQSQWWNLFAGVGDLKRKQLGLDLNTLQGRTATIGVGARGALIPIAALPYTYILTPEIRESVKIQLRLLKQPEIKVSAVLTESTSDDTLDPLFTEDQLDALLDYVAAQLDVDALCRSQRDELTSLVAEFEWLLSDLHLDFLDATAPVEVPRPIKPAVPEYVINSDDKYGRYIRSQEWVDYEDSLEVYQQYLDDKAKFDAAIEAARIAQNDKIYHIQRRAGQVTKEIETTMDSLWSRITSDFWWLDAFLDTQGGVASYIDVDYVNGTGKEDRFYVATFVTDWGEESAPSPVSAWHYTGYRDWVVVEAPIPPSGRAVVGWRLYRGSVGQQQTSFQLVSIRADDEQAAKATFNSGGFSHFNLGVDFNDKVPSENLGETLPTTSWLEPPQDLKCLTSMPNGVMAGFVGNTIHFCEPYVPYAWPVEYQVTVDSRIVGLGVFGQTLFVGTEGSPYFVSGADSASMSAQKVDSNQACASRRSIASVQGGVLYASPDGLCLADGAGVRLVTQGVFAREDWQALSPNSMLGIEHDGIYHLFYKGSGGGCLTFDYVTRKLGRIDAMSGVTAAYVDRTADALYVVKSNQVVQMNGGSGRLTGLWKSPRITLPAQQALSWVKVYGEQGSTTPAIVRWYGDGELRHTAVFTGMEPQRLPAGRWLEHEVEIESSARISRVILAGSVQELQST